MSSHVDIHAHVLPGIDDGPSDLASSIAMGRAAAGAGTDTLVSTPHLRADFPDVHVHELAGRCQRLRETFQQEEIALRLVCGAEVSLTWALDATDEELALASYGQLGRDLLIETPTVSALGLDRLLHELRVKGFRITLAHPERSEDFQRDSALLRDLVDQGVLLQINVESLLGSERQSAAHRLGRQLCAAGLAHVLASDAHRASSWRPVTRLAEGARAAAALVGPERALWLVQGAPAAIIDGVSLPAPPAVIRQRRRSSLFGLQR